MEFLEPMNLRYCDILLKSYKSFMHTFNKEDMARKK